MLDVNTDLEGSINDNFKAYDRQWNLDVLYSFCDRYGIELSKIDAAEFTEFLESFECAR